METKQSKIVKFAVSFYKEILIIYFLKVQYLIIKFFYNKKQCSSQDIKNELNIVQNNTTLSLSLILLASLLLILVLYFKFEPHIEDNLKIYGLSNNAIYLPVVLSVYFIGVITIFISTTMKFAGNHYKLGFIDSIALLSILSLAIIIYCTPLTCFMSSNIKETDKEDILSNIKSQYDIQNARYFIHHLDNYLPYVTNSKADTTVEHIKLCLNETLQINEQLHEPKYHEINASYRNKSGYVFIETMKEIQEILKNCNHNMYLNILSHIQHVVKDLNTYMKHQLELYNLLYSKQTDTATVQIVNECKYMQCLLNDLIDNKEVE